MCDKRCEISTFLESYLLVCHQIPLARAFSLFPLVSAPLSTASLPPMCNRRCSGLWTFRVRRAHPVPDRQSWAGCCRHIHASFLQERGASSHALSGTYSCKQTISALPFFHEIGARQQTKRNDEESKIHQLKLLSPYALASRQGMRSDIEKIFCVAAGTASCQRRIRCYWCSQHQEQPHHILLS